MQNPDDKYIFDKVRATLEEYQPECSSSSWNKMSVLLNQQPKAVKPISGTEWFKGFISGVLVTIVLVGSLYFIFEEKTSEPKQTSATNVAAIDIKTNKSPEVLKANQKSEIIKNNSKNDYAQVSSGVADVYNIDLSELKDDEIAPNEQIASYELARDLRRADNDRANFNDNTVSFRTIVPKGFNADNYIRVEPEKIVGFHPKSKPAIRKVDRSNGKTKLITINWDLFKGSFGLQDDMYKKFIGPDKIKLGYSPEVVFGNFQSKSGISHGLGLALEGSISKRLSVGIGVNLRKYEWTKRKEFKSLQMDELPDTSYHYVVDSTHQNVGKWQYFELPVSFSLHFMTFGKSKIFINTSIAAVIMQSENYEFNRIIGQDKFLQKTELKPFSNYNILGNIRVGFEYRYAINRRWNLYFEPYYKWYLKGVGVTSYKPRSFGINVGLIYQFNLHKK